MAGVSLLTTSAQSAEPVPGVRGNLEVEDLGTPLHTRSTGGGAVVRDINTGDLHLLVIMQAYDDIHAGQDPPYQIYDLNLATGKARLATGIVQRYGKIIVARSGKVYIGGQRPAAFNEYDLATGKSKHCGKLVPFHWSGTQSVAEGPDGRIYAGLAGVVRVAIYDPKTGAIDLGPKMGEEGEGGARYVYTMAVTDDYVYCGIARVGDWWLVAYHPATKEYKEYFKPEAGEKSGGGVVTAKDGVVYYGRGQEAYLCKDGAPVKTDLNPRRIKAWHDPNVYTLPEAKTELNLEIDLSDVFPTNLNGGEVTVRWRKLGEETWQTNVTKGADVRPSVPKCLIPLPDGRLLGCAAFYGVFYTFDPKTRKTDLLGASTGSVYDVLPAGGKVYICGYKSFLSVYDPAQPWTFSAANARTDRTVNPWMINRGSESNTVLAVAADGAVFFGGISERHHLGGAVVRYDPGNDEFKMLREEFSKFAISDLIAINDGKRLAASYGREVVLMDPAAPAVLKRVALPEDVPDAGHLLDAGPGQVLGLTRVEIDKEKKRTDPARYGGMVYKVNVATGETIFHRPVAGKVFAGALPYDLRMERDARFCAGPDGCGWLFIERADGKKNLCRIHPFDGAVEVVRADCGFAGRMFFVGKDLYIYNGGRQNFNGFSSIKRIRRMFE